MTGAASDLTLPSIQCTSGTKDAGNDMEEITVKAYGKLNLCLDVTGKREDGYHLVKMIMQTVDIYDTVTIRPAASGEITLHTNSGDIPAGPDNLVFRAADLMRREFHLPGGFDITLIKRIPIAAGMAGGSADAAAVMRGIRDLMCGEVTDEKLEKLSLPLGADIPYCIQGGTKLCEGIGEVLTELPPMPDCFLVVVKPDIFVSTPWVYREYDSIPEDQIRHPDVDAMERAIRQEDLPAMAALCGNVLEQKTGAAYPVIGELEAFLLRQGAITSIMTGSGPTVFGIFTEQQAAVKAKAALDAVPEYSAFQKFVTKRTSGD